MRCIYFGAQLNLEKFLQTLWAQTEPKGVNFWGDDTLWAPAWLGPLYSHYTAIWLLEATSARQDNGWTSFLLARLYLRTLIPPSHSPHLAPNSRLEFCFRPTELTIIHSGALVGAHGPFGSAPRSWLAQQWSSREYLDAGRGATSTVKHSRVEQSREWPQFVPPIGHHLPAAWGEARAQSEWNRHFLFVVVVVVAAADLLLSALKRPDGRLNLI